jgi:ribosomal protein S12 methylthiotransferase
MDVQVPEDVKRSRVEELMLAQQQIAFAKARQKIGQTLEVLIDRPARHDDSNWIARSTAQAPDIDSVTYVQGDDLHVGQLMRVRIVDADGYDSVAQLPTHGKILPILNLAATDAVF